jgi:hypothetical protein
MLYKDGVTDVARGRAQAQMQTWRPAREYRLAIALLACMMAVPAAAQQQLQPLTLDDILLRLESNLHQYDSQVPSFLCDEHVVSQILSGRGQTTVTDSVFRLKRTTKPDHTTVLDESRDIKTVNGRPAVGEELNGPSVLSGAFSGGLAIVSLSQKACMNYKLKPIKPDHLNDPYIVQFATVPSPEHIAECLLQETGSGRIFIDPATMQIKRMELTAPQHVLNFSGTLADGRPIPPAIGIWTIAIDYTPILLGGRSFWMPSTITSNMVANLTTWSFEAHYANYHKLEVTSRIVPSTEEPAP